MALNFPNSPGIGSVFTDTTSGFSYEWDGTVWKSYSAASTSNIKIIDDISGSFNGSTQTFALTINNVSLNPVNAQSLIITLGGVTQEPIVDYTVSTSNIVFTEAPAAGLNFGGISLGPAVPVAYANDGNVYIRNTYTGAGTTGPFSFSQGYTVGYLDVYRNGVRLRSGTDFVGTSGTNFYLTDAAAVDDELEAIGYLVSSLVQANSNLDNLNVTGITTTNRLQVNINANVTGILTASSFVGPLTGNVTGTATTATTATSAGYATTAGISTNVKGTGSRVLYNSSTDTTTTSANLTFNGTTLSVNSTPGANTSALSLTGVPFGSNTKNGLLGVGTLGFTDSNLIANFTDDVNSYAQVIIQNLNSGNAASADFVVNSDSPLGQTYYGDFGINGTAYNGGGPFGDTSGTYLYSKGGTLSVGTDDAQDFRIATGSGPATPITRVTVKGTSGNVGIGSTLPTSTLTVQGNASISGVITTSSAVVGSAATVNSSGVNIGVGVTITNTLTANETRVVTGAEKVHRQSGNTVTLTYNSATSSNVGYTTNPSGDVTVNVVGIPTSSDFDDYSVTFAVVVNNTGTAITCTAVNLNGVSRTIRWVGGSLSNAIAGVTTTNGHTVFSFTGINTVGSASTAANYQVLGTVSGGFW